MKRSFGKLVDDLINAINRQEGRPADYANPGDLRAAPWLTKPTIDNAFWVPISRAQGVAGEGHVIALHIAEGDTLRELIARWAPPNENNTTLYLDNVAAWTILDKDTPLYEYVQC